MSKEIHSWQHKKGIFRKCSSTIWNPFSKYSSGECQQFVCNKMIPLEGSRSNRIWESLMSRKLFSQEYVLILEWDSSMLDNSLIIWRRIYGWSKISAFWSWRMQICIQRKAGLLFSEWPNRVGGSASRVTRDIIQTSDKLPCASLHPKLHVKFNIVPSKLPATSCPMFFPSVIVKDTNVSWTAQASLKRQIKNRLLYALSA